MTAMEFLSVWLEENGNPEQVDRILLDREFKKFKNPNSHEQIQSELLNQIHQYKVCVERIPEDSAISKIQYNQNSLDFSTIFFNDIWYSLMVGGNVRTVNELIVDPSTENSIQKIELMEFLNRFSNRVRELEKVSLSDMSMLTVKMKKEFSSTFD